MESHISHLIASSFSFRPKGSSTKRITKYLKPNDYEIFTTDKIHNIPMLNNGRNTRTYIYLNNISHEISIETYTLNETNYIHQIIFQNFLTLIYDMYEFL